MMTYTLSFILVTLFIYSFHNASANTTTPGDTLSTRQSLATVDALSATPTSTATCNSSEDMSSLCPSRDESIVTWGDAGRWAVFCGRLLTKATYYEDEQASTVEQCIDACMQFETCNAPVVSPDGRCYLQVLGHDDEGRPEGLPIQEPGWAVLLPASHAGENADETRSVFPYDSATSTSSNTAVETHPSPDRQEYCQSLVASSMVSCPACNDAFVEGSLGYIYQVLCYRQWVHSSDAQILDFDLPRCMVQCEKTHQCLGFTISPAGCGLAFGNKTYVQGSSPNATAFLLSPSNAPTTFPSSANGGVESCRSASSVSCPACANAYVKDDSDKIYHILCDSSLYSERFYSVQYQTTPKACMLECDKFSWCRGVNFQSPGSCKLARGEDVFPQESFGSMAFLPVNLSYTPSPPQLSAYPTGEFSSVRQTSAESSSMRSSSMRPSPAKSFSNRSPAPSLRATLVKTHSLRLSSSRSASAIPTELSCSVNYVHCRQCDGLRVLDYHDQAYRVQCNFQPICNHISSNTLHITQGACMVNCDRDATCLAAIWRNGRCDLCHGSLEGLATYESPPGYVVFVAERHSGPSHSPSSTCSPSSRTSRSLHSCTIPKSTARTTTPHTSRTSANVPMRTPPIDISSLRCPPDNESTAMDRNNGREYCIECDRGYGAEEYHSTTASNFAACASLCSRSCDGFEFGSHSRCELFTDTYLATPKPSVTGGALIWSPPNIDGATVTSADAAL